MPIMMVDKLLHILLLLLLPPLLLGVINRTKAAFAGRQGAPLLQPYYELAKLLRKDSVYSSTTTWIFRAGPVVTLAATLLAAMLMPLGGHPALISFQGDMILFAYLFGLARFFTTSAALDTGSAFEGMGAAREVTFACLVEPTLFFILTTLARMSTGLSLTPMLTAPSTSIWLTSGAGMLLMSSALFVALLAENCRIPFDDPNTHLELTMIHEVMVLDHSGPGFGLILYGAALKLFVLGAFFVNLVQPLRIADSFGNWGLFVVSMLLLAILIGTVESVMARLRLVRIPQLLVAATIMSAFAMLLTVR